MIEIAPILCLSMCSVTTYQCCSALGVADVGVLPGPEEVIEQGAVPHRGDREHITSIALRLASVLSQQVLDLHAMHLDLMLQDIN